jgi:hypothetical protein
MTEKELQLLGFECHYDDGDGDWDKYHYYTYTVARGFEFISCASDETQDGNWWVEFFESDPTIRFYDFAKVQALINTLEKHIVKKDDKVV